MVKLAMVASFKLKMCKLSGTIAELFIVIDKLSSIFDKYKLCEFVQQIVFGKSLLEKLQPYTNKVYLNACCTDYFLYKVDIAFDRSYFHQLYIHSFKMSTSCFRSLYQSINIKASAFGISVTFL